MVCQRKFKDNDHKESSYDFTNKSYSHSGDFPFNNSQIKIERALPSQISDTIRIATEVFAYEQNIPESLIPVNEDLKPIWWCAKAGEDIIGVSAAWVENNQWHWGRFAVNKSFRGLGIGRKIAIFSLNEIFNSDVENIYIEAREITVKMLKRLGAEVTGVPIDFYGRPVTPIIIKKCDFVKIIKL